MPKVQVLSSDIIAKIAAGEVVERPASVVKELLENSLDAGATRVELHIKEGGKTLIHIKDNGRGIEKDDLEVLFTRHATSKIADASDLDAIASLGFRGEALYSIASVSEVTLRSWSRNESEAWEIEVVGGEKGKVHPGTLPSSGTDIRVSGLFFNTPARKKFLKSDAAEFDQILNVVMPYALYYPEKEFLVTHNGRTALDLRTAGSAVERAAEALGVERRHIITPEAYADGDFRLAMLLGDINIQRPRRDLQYLFVNGRPVQSRNLSFHVNETYKLIFPPAVHPFFIIMLTLPAGEVDVNVHPTKREVRLREESRMGSILRHSVESALMTGSSAKEIAKGSAGDMFAFPETTCIPGMQVGIPAEKIQFAPGQASALPKAGWVDMSIDSVFAFGTEAKETQTKFIDDNPVQLKDRLSAARFVGTFILKYHLFESGESLFVIDQHAAQERILFEQFRSQINAGRLEVQQLLAPIVMSATPQEMLALERATEQLKAFGFEVEPFGPSALALRAHPVAIPDPEQAVRMLLGEDDLSKADPHTVATRACRASVMTGDRMLPEEAVYQLKTLLACADPYTCPHGRPIFIEIKNSFLDRQFLRT